MAAPTFAQPAGVVVQRIDPTSGLLAAPSATGMDEVFVEGTPWENRAQLLAELRRAETQATDVARDAAAEAPRHGKFTFNSEPCRDQSA